MKRADSFEEMVQVFTSFPLDEGNFDLFYVDTGRERSDIDARKNIINSFRLEMNPYMKVLFTGHKGCGKSTELLSISKELCDKYEIINFSIAEETEIQGLKYVDLVFLIMEEIVEYIHEKDDIVLNEDIINKMTGYWKQEQITEITEYDNRSLESEVGGGIDFLSFVSARIKGVLKTGTESKQTFRMTLEPRLSVLINMINAVIADINDQLEDRYKKQLLIIIEDMDKLDIAESREIFVDHCRSLAGLQVKMLFSFPIFMVYTSEFSMIRNVFDNYVLYSMIKVCDSDGERYDEGIEILKRIVHKRASENLIDDEALEYMILKSGGALRDLFDMLRQAAFYAMDKNSTKIDLDVAKRMALVLQGDYIRNISSDAHYKMLKTVYKDPFTPNNDEVLRDLLRTLSVIEYNGRRWLGVHPVLRDYIKMRQDRHYE